jgi:hypothetical protein
MQAAIWIGMALIVFFAPTWLSRPGHRLSVFVINATRGFTFRGYSAAVYLAARSWER